jgi:hypothetical protein
MICSRDVTQEGEKMYRKSALQTLTTVAAALAALGMLAIPSWLLAPDNLSVTQTVNGQPTFFVSDFDIFDHAVEVTIRNDTSWPKATDDDYIGFALGYQPGDTVNPSADYLLIHWKKGSQPFNFADPPFPATSPACLAGPAPAGLGVSRVTGIPTHDEFWQRTDLACNPSGGLEELQRGATRGSSGYAPNTDYRFRFEYTPTSLRVFVDGTLELDIAGSFNDGRLAFYNFSQSGIVYSAIEATTLANINIHPGSDPNSINTCSKGATPVTIWGSDILDVATIDADQLVLASATVKTVGRSDETLCSTADVGAPDESYFDGLDPVPDGFDDLTCKFLTYGFGLDDTATTAQLSITGCDDGVSCTLGDSGYYLATGVDLVNIVRDCE